MNRYEQMLRDHGWGYTVAFLGDQVARDPYIMLDKDVTAFFQQHCDAFCAWWSNGASATRR